MLRRMMMSASGPPPSLVIDVVPTSSATAVTPFAVAMPAVVAAGDLLVVVMSIGGGVGTVSASGWTQRQAAVAGASVVNIRVYTRVATGSEGGTTVNFTSVSSHGYSAVCLRVPAAFVDSGQAPESAIALGNSNTADPPNLTPSWGAMNNIWLAIFVSPAGPVISSYPFTDGQFDYASGTWPGPYYRVAGCHIRTPAASLNPTAFPLSFSDMTIAMTMAIKPP